MTALALRFSPYAERLNRLTLRERALVFAAAVALAFVVWQVLFMDRLVARQRAATQELAAIQERLATFEAGTLGSEGMSSDPLLQAAARQRALGVELARVDGQLAAVSAGFAEPARMAEVVRSVMSQQPRLSLVSLRNLPVESMLPVAEGQKPQGPYLHPLEIVVEGDYFAVIDYLRDLAALPWRLQWRIVEVEAREYPINRVRIELCTLSLSPEWLSIGKRGS